MGNFVHLHLHTEFSLLDGAARYVQVVKKCKSLGMPAVAITDHGNMYGVMLFYNECTHNGIKPIIGCEFYLCSDMNSRGKFDYNHLIILAKNQVGYENLCKLSTLSYTHGFYYKPRIDYATLEKYHEGLIVLSACLRGDIPQYILKGMDAEAMKQAEWYKNLFGDDFYLEMQNHYLEEDRIINPKLKEIGRKLGIKTVVTNDVHYINREDAELQDVLSCIDMGKRIDDPDRMKMPNSEFYLKTYDEMAQMFPGDEESLATTLEIAEKCNVKFEFGHYHFPKFQLPEGETNPESYLWKLINAGIEKKFGAHTPEIDERIEKEMSLIESQGFVEYFLTVRDYIQFAKSHDIDVGPGRGSGAGSLVAYTIGITNVDPLKYDLFFERFINKERITAPDFDIDFQDNRRDEVYNYVLNKYGPDRVVKIITFNKMKAKNAIKDVGRVLRVPYSVTDNITKLMPNPKPGDENMIVKLFGLNPDDTTGRSADLVELYNSSDDIKRMVDIAAKLEDTPRNTSVHPCGVLIGFDNLFNYIPLAKIGDDVTTQYENKWLEKLGHLKFDFLGLRNLTDIKYAKKYIKENYDVDIDFDKHGYDDKDVFDMISRGDTKAVFQFESGGMVRFMKELMPTRLEDLIAGVALYRPGPMDEIPNYVYGKHHPDKIKYLHPDMENIVKDTYGVIVYQEQVMLILQTLAGYSLGQADIVRRMMSKKELDNMAKEKLVFLNGRPAEGGKPAIDGVLKRGMSEELANTLWNAIEKFASYAFNKSHAAVYAFVAYQTAYLKCHYEKEFLTAVLNNRITAANEITNYVRYAKEKGIEVLPPDINLSDTYFTCKGKENKIRFGLAALKNVGINLIDSIIAERDRGGNYKDLYDFINRQAPGNLNKRCMESLILSGAFDCFGKNRSQLMNVYPKIIDRVAADKNSRAIGQYSLFDTVLVDDESNKIEYPDMPEYSYETKLKLEKSLVGIYISGHPLDKYKEKLDTFEYNSEDMSLGEGGQDNDDNNDEIITLGGLKDGDHVTMGGMITEYKRHMNKAGKEMAFAKLEDLHGSVEITIFPLVYAKNKDIAKDDNLVTISGKLNLRPGMPPSVVVDSIVAWERIADSADQGPHAREKTLYLMYDLTNIALHESIVKSLKSYPGTTPVVAKCSVTGKAYQIGCEVNTDSFLMSELRAFIPDHHMKVC